MTAQAFLLVGIAALNFILAGTYAVQFHWPAFGAYSFLGGAMLCFAMVS
jgi:hypothetical protein